MFESIFISMGRRGLVVVCCERLIHRRIHCSLSAAENGFSYPACR